MPIKIGKFTKLPYNWPLLAKCPGYLSPGKCYITCPAVNLASITRVIYTKTGQYSELGLIVIHVVLCKIETIGPQLYSNTKIYLKNTFQL